ncbi:MAG: TolC family protein, partial [Elusimicrobiaceae bacterium]
EAKRWLAVQSYAKAQLAFPKGPADVSFNQNVAGVNISMPLWDDGRTKNSAAAQGALANNYRQQYNRARRDIFRDFETAREELAALREQLLTDKKAQAEAEEIAGLVYKMYETGQRTYLDVQNANVRALSAGVETARTQAQILLQLALIDSLGD